MNRHYITAFFIGYFVHMFLQKWGEWESMWDKRTRS